MTLALQRIRKPRLSVDSRARARTCLAALDVRVDGDILPAHFAQARKNWLHLAVEARDCGDGQTERTVNIAWQRLKAWRCIVCGGAKPLTKYQTCGRRECVNKQRNAQIRRVAGPIVLRFRGRQSTRSYQGHGLRQAQYNALKRALERNDYNVAAAARDLRMSYQTIKYYIRKFGGYARKGAAAAILLLLAGWARAGSVTLAWDPNPEPDVAAYVIYYGPASRQYTHATNVGNVTIATVRGLPDTNGTTYFAVTAVSTLGLESDFSNEVTNRFESTTIPLRLELAQSKSPAGPWTNIFSTNMAVRIDGGGFWRQTLRVATNGWASWLGEDTNWAPAAPASAPPRPPGL